MNKLLILLLATALSLNATSRMSSKVECHGGIKVLLMHDAVKNTVTTIPLTEVINTKPVWIHNGRGRRAYAIVPPYTQQIPCPKESK